VKVPIRRPSKEVSLSAIMFLLLIVSRPKIKDLGNLFNTEIIAAAAALHSSVF
jgi:hypothetical protein